MVYPLGLEFVFKLPNFIIILFIIILLYISQYWVSSVIFMIKVLI